MEKNKVSCHSLLQWIISTQGSNLGLLHCKQILYHLRHQEKGCEIVFCHMRSFLEI